MTQEAVERDAVEFHLHMSNVFSFRGPHNVPDSPRYPRSQIRQPEDRWNWPCQELPTLRIVQFVRRHLGGIDRCLLNEADIGKRLQFILEYVAEWPKAVGFEAKR